MSVKTLLKKRYMLRIGKKVEIFFKFTSQGIMLNVKKEPVAKLEG